MIATTVRFYNFKIIVTYHFKLSINVIVFGNFSNKKKT